MKLSLDQIFTLFLSGPVLYNNSHAATPANSQAATGDGDVGRDTPPRDPDSPLDLVVIPSELSGMRALWSVALEAEDVTVVDQATRLLNRTHQVCEGYASFVRL